MLLLKQILVEVYSSNSDGNWAVAGERLLGEQCETSTRFHAYFGRDVLSNAGDVVAVGGRGIVCIFYYHNYGDKVSDYFYNKFHFFLSSRY